MMKPEQLIGAKVVDIARGTTVGETSGVLIDQDEMRVVALQIGGGTFSAPRYIAYSSVESVEHDVVTIPSPEHLIERRNFKSIGLTEHITGRRVVTEDGKDLGTIHSYSIDPKTGKITSVTFGVDKSVLGGLWKSASDRYDIPSKFIKTLGEIVVVENSVPDVVGLHKAA